MRFLIFTICATLLVCIGLSQRLHADIIADFTPYEEDSILDLSNSIESRNDSLDSPLLGAERSDYFRIFDEPKSQPDLGSTKLRTSNVAPLIAGKAGPASPLVAVNHEIMRGKISIGDQIALYEIRSPERGDRNYLKMASESTTLVLQPKSGQQNSKRTIAR